MLVATRDIPEAEVKQGITRIEEAHELRDRYPDAWRQDTPPGSVWCGRGPDPNVNGHSPKRSHSGAKPIPTTHKYDLLHRVARQSRGDRRA